MSEIFLGNEFAENPEPRNACVLLLDTSGSMSDDPIKNLNEGLKTLEQEIKKNDMAKLRAEIAIITFHDKCSIIQDFVSAADFFAPTLSAGGVTALGEGIEKALSMLTARKQEYKHSKINYYRPWLFIITDGAPTDEWKNAAQKLIEEEERGGVVTFAIGVEGADFNVLRELSKRRSPLKLKGLSFAKYFEWLSNSLSSASEGDPGDQLAMEPVDGWGAVPT